ncbi:MAG: LCP family protein [Oscillospiraceae bacterium]
MKPHIYKKPEKKKTSKKKVALIAGGAVMAVLLVFVVSAAIYINSKFSMLNRSVSYESVISLSPEDEELTFGGLNLDDIDVMENGGNITPPEGEVNVNSSVTNILLIGSDERSDEISSDARADSMMLLSINSKDNTWKLASFERGVGVSIPNHCDDWLTHTFAYGGPELLMKTLRDYYKLDISKYVRINFTIFETGVTDIGGVEVELTEAEAEYMNGIAGQKKWEAGPARLDGPTALVYARIRHLDSDWNRVSRQRKVIQAAANQIATLSPAKIDAIANKLLPLLETNLTNAELWQLSFKMPALLSGQAAQITVPKEEDSWGIQLANGRVVIGCDFAAEAERLNQFITGVLPPEAESSSSVAASSGASSGASSRGLSSSSSYGGQAA